MFSSKLSRAQRLLQVRHTLGGSAAGGRASSSTLVLGIETSCDDTGAAVLDDTGRILGESLHSQKEVHLRTGGIIPIVAQKLHRQNIERVVQEALDRSCVHPRQLAAVATTVKPGLALSLGIGLEFSQRFVRQHNKPFIPIHHMEAHALTVRMLHPVNFPFLVLLVSGGHSLLAVARGVDDFLLLGRTLDEAPGDTLDKVARRLSLVKHPECSTLSGGQAIEHLAKTGDRKKFFFTTPMGVEQGTLLSCANDIAAAVQHTVASHLAKRTHRAILFCRTRGLLPSHRPTLVLSGGVASNQYIRGTLSVIAEKTGLDLLCPPAQFCTDNGVMIAWNGVERLREGKGILPPDVDVHYEPKSPLGVDMTAEVRAAKISLRAVKIKFPD